MFRNACMGMKVTETMAPGHVSGQQHISLNSTIRVSIQTTRSRADTIISVHPPLPPTTHP